MNTQTFLPLPPRTFFITKFSKSWVEEATFKGSVGETKRRGERKYKFRTEYGTFSFSFSHC